jgi:hypothetical protein
MYNGLCSAFAADKRNKAAISKQPIAAVFQASYINCTSYVYHLVLSTVSGNSQKILPFKTDIITCIDRVKSRWLVVNIFAKKKIPYKLNKINHC